MQSIFSSLIPSSVKREGSGAERRNSHVMWKHSSPFSTFTPHPGHGLVFLPMNSSFCAYSSLCWALVLLAGESPVPGHLMAKAHIEAALLAADLRSSDTS